MDRLVSGSTGFWIGRFLVSGCWRSASTALLLGYPILGSTKRRGRKFETTTETELSMGTNHMINDKHWMRTSVLGRNDCLLASRDR